MTHEELHSLQPGDRVIDSTGRIGEVCTINETKAIRHEIKGGFHYTFFFRVIPEELEIYTGETDENIPDTV